MTQKEKQMLLRDLCARLPYGVKYNYGGNEGCDYTMDRISLIAIDDAFPLEDVKPYLRPMSSMTEEEKERLQSLHDIISNENYGDGYSPSAWDAITEWEDYCNSRHLDYHGLIPMGLALEAPEDMYKEN